MVKIVKFFFLLVLVYSCGAGKKATSIEQLAVDVQNANDSLLDTLNETGEILTGDEGAQKVSTIADDFIGYYCHQMGETPNPFELEKYLSSERALALASTYLSQFKGAGIKCQSFEYLFKKGKILTGKFKFDRNLGGIEVIFNLRVDGGGLLQGISLSFLKGVDFKYDDVAMKDGTTLATYSFIQKNKKSTTVLIRSPYLPINGETYLGPVVSKYLKKSMNVVIQSNRGVFPSTGEFKWLHKINISDGSDAITWIKSQESSNGKIALVGTSYDGFNALSAAASNDPGIFSVLACSAPIDTKSDSFTSGGSVESFLISYAGITKMVARSNYRAKLAYLKQTKVPLSEYDNYIVGRDIPEWNDLLKVISGEPEAEKSYYQNRTSSEELLKIKAPTYFVAGNTHDQDSRDTLKSFTYLQLNAPNNKHSLYLHGGGHGCGDFAQTAQGKEYNNQLEHSQDQLKVLTKKVAVYSMAQKKVIEGDSYPPSALKKKTIFLSNQGGIKKHAEFDQLRSEFSHFSIGYLFDYLPGVNPNNFPIEQSIYVKINEHTTLNGPIKLNLNLENESLGSTLSAYAYIVRPDNSISTVHRIPRAYHPLKVQGNEQVSLTFPPTNHLVLAGSYLVIKLSLDPGNLITPYKRQAYLEKNTYGQVVLFDSPFIKNHIELITE
ncbi:MAG: CocE/NonD family hydrolase [Bacteriovoracaceae bacterium]|jgi:putative CocE/NonD family hydrolase|nr:CocE/NonD family hydrolase [Bacteriovoracaceae bacterium]